MKDDHQWGFKEGIFRYSREAERTFLFYATIGMVALYAVCCLLWE